MRCSIIGTIGPSAFRPVSSVYLAYISEEYKYRLGFVLRRLRVIGTLNGSVRILKGYLHGEIFDSISVLEKEVEY